MFLYKCRLEWFLLLLTLRSKSADLASYILQKKDLGCTLAKTVNIIEESKHIAHAASEFWKLLGGNTSYSSKNMIYLSVCLEHTCSLLFSLSHCKSTYSKVTVVPSGLVWIHQSQNFRTAFGFILLCMWPHLNALSSRTHWIILSTPDLDCQKSQKRVIYP